MKNKQRTRVLDPENSDSSLLITMCWKGEKIKVRRTESRHPNSSWEKISESELIKERHKLPNSFVSMIWP